MKIATTVEMSEDDIREAIQDYAKKKFRKKEFGPVKLEQAAGDLFGVRATFELRDKPESENGASSSDTAEA